jgi:hypothetical protein
MKKKVVNVDGRQLQVGRLTVQEINDMLGLEHDRAKTELLAVLKESEVDSATRLEELKALEERKGFVTDLVRSVFTMQGAIRVISYGNDGNFPEEYNELRPDDLTMVAMHMLGFDEEDFANTESSAEGKEVQEKPLETG